MPQRYEGWRAYQESLKKRQRKKERRASLIAGMKKSGFGLVILLLVGAAAFGLWPHGSAKKEAPAEVPQETGLSPEVVHSLLPADQMATSTRQAYSATVEGAPVTVSTTLNIELQEFLISEFKRNIAKKRGTPRYVSAVAMDAQTGRVIALAGISGDKGSVNPSLEAHYPAASLFKIVTASAAVETLGLSPTSKLNFNGGKYTLYKRQLTNKKNRYTNTITLRDSFAQSVNPVFGKLGALRLKKEKLAAYGDKFFFNRPIDFDLPVQPSVLTLEDKPYQWAEVACGFNRTTLISPLHGALLASAAANGGVIPAPILVESVVDNEAKELYSANTHPLGRVTSSKSAQAVQKLMERTIRSGTAKKSFSGYRRDAVLKNLTLGGKTGSIFNRDRDVRVDWFVGFAKEKKTGRTLAVSVVVGHQKYIGTRAAQYARMAITNFFSQPPVQKMDGGTKVAASGTSQTAG